MCGCRGRVYDMRDVIDESDSLGYTDLCYSPHFAPVVSINRHSNYETVSYSCEDRKLWDKAFHEEFDIKVGAPCKCLKCGNRYIEQTDSFMCDDCIEDMEAEKEEDCLLHCEQCGAPLYDAGEVYWKGVVALCEECYNTLVEGE